MSQPAVKMADVIRHFRRAPGYILEYIGDDLIIKKLPTGTGQRGKPIVRIGHRFASHLGSNVPPGILKKIKRTFGISREDILNG
jgi:hypothetical protein